jgi:hypothetical protein
VFVVDTHPDRLALAEQLGAVAINGVGDEAVNKILARSVAPPGSCGTKTPTAPMPPVALVDATRLLSVGG